MIPLDPAGLEAAARQLAENERLAPNGERARDSAAEVVRAYLAAAGRAAATPDPPKGESHGKAEERERIVKELREAAHGGNRGQPGSFWVGWRAAARAIEEGWAEKPETDT